MDVNPTPENFNIIKTYPNGVVLGVDPDGRFSIRLPEILDAIDLRASRVLANIFAETLTKLCSLAMYWGTVPDRPAAMDDLLQMVADIHQSVGFLSQIPHCPRIQDEL